MFYKNISYSEKTFHGVTFKPNETKEVFDYINSPFMILSSAPEDNKEQQKPSPESKPKKEVQKSSKEQKVELVVQSEEKSEVILDQSEENKENG